MHYTAYLQQTVRAADAADGEFISLAGGYYGVRIATFNPERFLILALDLDGNSGWAVWPEDARGERLSEQDITLGWLPLSELARAARAADRHGSP